VQINKSSDAMSDEIFKMIPNIVGDAMFDWRAAKDSVTFDDIIKVSECPANRTAKGDMRSSSS